MRKKLLSIGRMIDIKNPQLIEPQISVLAVNLNREGLEEIRKKRGIPIRTLENKIGLSKSRYYRWLQYQIDLPLEIVIGLKKVLNMSDSELMNFFVSSTDEQIQLLTLVIYSSTMDTPENKARFLRLKDKLEKFRISSNENLSYKLILAYTDIVAQVHPQIVEGSLEKIENYFLGIDHLSLFDIFLYLATLQVKQEFSMYESFLEKEIVLLEKSILKKITEENLQEWRSILIGCVLDISTYYYQKGDYEAANMTINKVYTTLYESKTLSSYSKEIINFVSNVYHYKNEDDEIYDEMKEKISGGLWCLPEYEIEFLESLLQREEYII